MKVNKKIYYHVNSNKNYNIGDVLIFDSNTHNGMYDKVYGTEYILNNKDANELLIDKKRNKELEFDLDELNLVLNTVNNDAFVMRELALEDVRKNKYPQYPSRFNCMYVVDTKDSAIKWCEILKRNNKKIKQILTLELTGQIFEFDGGTLYRKNLSYSNHLKNAMEYWKCENDIKEKELLFLGEAKVVSIENIEN